MSDSTLRLLSTGRVDPLAEVVEGGERAVCSRSSTIRRDEPLPTLRTADSPNGISPGVPAGSCTPGGASAAASAVKSDADRLTSGVQHLMPIARHSAR